VASGRASGPKLLMSTGKVSNSQWGYPSLRTPSESLTTHLPLCLILCCCNSDHPRVSVSALAAHHSAHHRRHPIHPDGAVLLLLLRPVVRAVLGGQEEKAGGTRDHQQATAAITFCDNERIQRRCQIQSTDGERLWPFLIKLLLLTL